MTNLPRETLDRKIKELQDQVLVLESMVRQATNGSVESLMNKDTHAARQIYANDALINKKRYEIERDCLITIATQQPMASDLRVLASIFEIITEIERMGDYAKGIAKITLLTEAEPTLPLVSELPKMAQIATNMLTKAIHAFIDQDIETARSLPKDDDLV
ncbi:MAG: phosphate transport system regulatory protein PhoU, partial [Anaerolineae bacterium]|nr:phosphate transport system regulatory protein PhoU [Anaerolineae bacterium]